MGGGSWNELIWISVSVFLFLFSILVILAGVLVLQGPGRVAGILLIVGAVVGIAGQAFTVVLNVQLRVSSLEQDVWERISGYMQAAHALSTIGGVVQVVGILLLAFAYRGIWRQLGQVRALSSGPPAVPR